MKRVRVDPEAERELAAAAEWYERGRVGLGAELIAAVDRTFDQIAERPDSHELWRAGRPYRRCVLDRFPFVVFFSVGDSVEVHAIAHSKRRPGYWLARGSR